MIKSFLDMIDELKNSIVHNAQYLIFDALSWSLLAFSHVLGLHLSSPVVVYLLPYMKFVSLLMATLASAFTIFKMAREIKKDSEK